MINNLIYRIIKIVRTFTHRLEVNSLGSSSVKSASQNFVGQFLRLVGDKNLLIVS